MILASPTSCIAINWAPRLRSAGTQILGKGSTRGLLLIVFTRCVHLHQERKHFLWQVLVELWNGSSALHLSQHARRIARLLSCKATNHSHNLIEPDLSWRNLRLRPIMRAKGRNRQIVPKWVSSEVAETHSGCISLRECKAAFRTSRTLRNH